MADGDKREEGRRPHTVIWDLSDWDRIGQAIEVLQAETHVEIDTPSFIRCAVMRRVDELLGAPAPPAAG
jgi:hypothetical protein